MTTELILAIVSALAVGGDESGTGWVPERIDLKLALWPEKRELAVYVLEVAKGGLKIQEQPRDPSSEIDEKGPFNVSVVADRAQYADLAATKVPFENQERDFVSIWSIAIAKSANRQYT